MKNEEFVRLTEIDPQLLDILCKIENDLFGSGDTYFTLPMFSKWGRFYIYKINKCIVAGSQLIKTFDDEQSVYLYGLWVVEKYRRQGIGKVFLDKIINKMKEEGIVKIQLTVSPKNTEAISLYKKAGFNKKELIKNFYGNNKGRILMIRTL